MMSNQKDSLARPQLAIYVLEIPPVPFFSKAGSGASRMMNGNVIMAGLIDFRPLREENNG